MQLIEFLFPEKAQREKVSDLAKHTVECLMDVSEPPDRAVFCFLDGDKVFTPLLQELHPFFLTAFSQIGRGEIEAFLSQYYPNSIPFVKEEAQDRFIKYLVVVVLWDEVPGLDEYVDYEMKGHSSKWDRLFEESQFDKEGLLYVQNSMSLRPQGLILEDNRLFYHPFLRRFYGSMCNFHGLTFFLEDLSKQKGLTLRIKLDPLRLGKAQDYRDVMELDHWFGPPFNPDRLNDPNYQGLTVYKNTDDEYKVLSQFPTDRTEFYVSNKSDGNKQIEIEEILDENAKLRTLLAPQKYAHMIWDPSKGCFIHFDVALMAYKKDKAEQRFRSNWKGRDIEPVKPICKVKLFRADGEISIDQAMELVSFFFYQNDQIHEFFSGKLNAVQGK